MAGITQSVELEHTVSVRRPAHWIHWLPPVLLALVLAAAALLVVGFELAYSNRIYPGVSVWGVDLGGLTREQAAALVEVSFPYVRQPALTLRDGDQVWQVRPDQVGARLETDSIVDAAYGFGRAGNWIERLQTQVDVWRNGRSLSPVVVFDPAMARAYLGLVAGKVNQPAQDAGISLQGTTVITTPAVTGRALDPDPVVRAMQDAIGAMQMAEIALPFHDVPPSLAAEDLPTAELSRLLGSPLELVELGPAGEIVRSWPIPPETLAQALSLRREGQRISIKLDENRLRPGLDAIAPTLVTTATSGRYVFDDETAQFIAVQHSTDGRELDIPATLAKITQQALTDNRRVPLIFRPIKAQYHDGLKPQDLGITQLVSKGVTYFKGSSATRIKNLAVAASKFHGIIIAPGETFSFNKYLGNVSLEEGYEEALIIVGDRTIKGVGGGVCQVSTTAFRAAFEAGFPIVERWPHAYRVSWYERGFGPGLDATVYAPLVDFKFTNDTPYHLLIETYTNVTDGILTFKFYSTSDGRKVVISPPEVSNIVAHGPDIYEEDPTLPPGTTQQVDWAVDGADVLVRRTVERNGVILYQDKIFTRYLPWQAVFKVGPPLPPEEPAPEP